VSSGPARTPFFAAVLARWQELRNAGLVGSVRDLCRTAGVSRTTWYALDSPNRRPVRATVTALAQALDMDADLLLRLAGYGQPDVAKPADSSDLAVTLDRGTER
jgi:transcriptional regulator with XRE-family HTH domain